MTVTEDTPFAPEDDTYHPASTTPSGSRPPGGRSTFPSDEWARGCTPAFHTNRGTVTWRVFLWDPTGADPGRLAYYKNSRRQCRCRRSRICANLQFPAGGFSVKMLTPLMDYHVGYRDPDADFSVEFEHRSVHPPRRFTPGEAPAMHNPHLDQLGHLTGELVLRGRAHPHRLLLGPRPDLGTAGRAPLAEPEGGVRARASTGSRRRVARAGARWSASVAVGGSSTSSVTPTARRVS